MSPLRLVFWAAVGVLASCSSGPEAGAEDAFALDHGVDAGQDEGPTDADVDADAPDARVDIGRPDMTADLDADIVDGALDARPDSSVEADCVDACCRLTACQGRECDAGYCAAYCSDVRRDQVFSDWLACHEAAGNCDDFSTCQRPSHPAPCPASCRFAREVCGVPWLEDCQRICDDPRLAGCVDEPLSCADPSTCLSNALVPGCGQLCAGLAACGGDEGACVTGCAASALADDPLPGLHLERDLRCVQFPAGGCEALTRCVAEEDAEVFLSRIDEDGFCALYDGCDLDAVTGCRSFYLEAREAGGWRAVDCVADALGRMCVDTNEALRAACFGPYNPTEEACEHFCLALSRCSQAPMQNPDPNCVNACMLQGTLHIETRTRYGRRVACRSEVTCDGLGACLDENPGTP